MGCVVEDEGKSRSPFNIRKSVFLLVGKVLGLQPFQLQVYFYFPTSIFVLNTKNETNRPLKFLPYVLVFSAQQQTYTVRAGV